MKTYARMVDGLVAEIIPEIAMVDGYEMTLEERYPADFIKCLSNYDATNPPALPPALVQSSDPPPVVAMRQVRLALLSVGKLTAIDKAIARLPSPQKEAAQIEWDYSAVVERNSAIASLLGSALELDEPALDALFIQAASL